MRVQYFILIVASLLLSACVADRLAFWQGGIDKSYAIQGLQDDQETQEAVREILDDRFSDDLSEGEELSTREEFARRDVLKVMQSRGYYDASVEFESKDEENGTYVIAPGKVVSIRSISVNPKMHSDMLAKLDLKVGDPLAAKPVIKAQNKLYNMLQKESCAFDLSVRHVVQLNTSTNKADVDFEVKQGRKASFGDVTFSGQTKVDESHMRHFIGWEEGECFRQDKIATARDKLLGTGLFSQVEVKLPDNAGRQSTIPVEFVVTERPRRSVKTGLSYYSDEGVSAILGWEHRNLFGSAESVNVDLLVSVLEQSLKSKFSKPFFYRDDQSLSLNAFIKREDTDAFEQFGTGGGFAVKRKINKNLSGSVGTDIELTRIDDKTEETEENFGLVSPNAALTFDNRDDPLDPHKGWLIAGSVKPFFDVLGESSPFIKSEITAQTYLDIKDKAVLAGRVKFGSIGGTNTEDVPATERFYAGGGGSVRGFGYQEVGPVDVNDDPVGGRSVFEGSAELRFKITDKIGGVTFVDAGYVDDEVVPSFDNLSVGAGVGARYYTDFGPLRFDVAVPVSGDDNTDQNFQIYISIGQAF